MALNASEVPNAGSGNRVTMEAGTYPARTVQIVDLGLQKQRPFQGQEKPDINEMLITYEFVDEFMKDDNGNDDETKPRWLSERMPLHNLGAEKAKSTKRYFALDPTKEYGGDFTKLLDVPCNVTIVQNPGKGANTGKVYENVANVAPMRAKDAKSCPELKGKAIFFDLDNPDLEVYARLAPWVQKVIQENLNFKGSKLDHLLGGVTENAQEVSEPEDEDENPY